MTDEQAACAHKRVYHVAVKHDNGTFSDRWECGDCKHHFWPEQIDLQTALALFAGQAADAIDQSRDRIGRMMHESWSRTKRAQGFHHTDSCPNGGGVTRNPCPKCHADLIDWAELPQQQKDINCRAFDDVLPILKKAILSLVPNPNALAALTAALLEAEAKFFDPGPPHGYPSYISETIRTHITTSQTQALAEHDAALLRNVDAYAAESILKVNNAMVTQVAGQCKLIEEQGEAIEKLETDNTKLKAQIEGHQHSKACYSKVPDTEGTGSYLTCGQTARLSLKAQIARAEAKAYRRCANELQTSPEVVDADTFLRWADQLEQQAEAKEEKP